MKPLACEMCGSKNIVKIDGIYICRDCETKYSVNAAKEMMSDANVSIPEINQGLNTSSFASASIVSETIENPEVKNQPITMSKAKKGVKKPVLIIGIIAIIAIIAGVYFGFLKDNKSKVVDAANSVLYLEAYNSSDELIATASGFIIDDGKTLVTNYHVIDGVSKIIAQTPDGKKSVEASTVLAYNERCDLAILQCKEDIGVKPLDVYDSDLAKQGDTVFAVGYPLGVAHTISDGVISSRYRDDDNIDLLQITSAISSGSSGGALLNESGKVIGVVCASYIEGQNLNIAIPSNYIELCLENYRFDKDLAYVTGSIPTYSVEYVVNHYEELADSEFYLDAWIVSSFCYHTSPQSDGFDGFYFANTYERAMNCEMFTDYACDIVCLQGLLVKGNSGLSYCIQPETLCYPGCHVSVFCDGILLPTLPDQPPCINTGTINRLN